MTTFTAGLAARLQRLVARLGDLRERVREAVAVEAGRAVGEAVQDVLAAALRGRPPEPVSPARPQPGRGRDSHWGDEADDWQDDEDDFDDHRGVPAEPPRPPAAGPPARAGWSAARWWASRTGPGRVGVVLGVLTAVAAAVGNPAVRAAVAVITAVADLAACTRAAPQPTT